MTAIPKTHQSPSTNQYFASDHFRSILDATQWPSNPQIVGQSPLRKEGANKVLGRAQYIDDITLPGMWFGATVRSTIPRGRISSIAFDPAIPWHEFTIVSAADIPGENTIVHLTKGPPLPRRHPRQPRRRTHPPPRPSKPGPPPRRRSRSPHHLRRTPRHLHHRGV